jgi:hypothetical protein
VSSSLTTIVILVSVIHLAAFVVMVWIRVRRCEADRTPGESVSITPCAVCGVPSTHRSYDGLDPDEQHDPHSGIAWSADMTHYPPLCAAH